MDIKTNVNFVPNYQVQGQNNTGKRTVAFSGELGDSYVSRIKNEEDVTTGEIYKEIKNPWYGINGRKFQDVMESFIESVKQLNKDNEKLNHEIQQRNITSQLIEIISDKTVSTFEHLVAMQDEQIEQLTLENEQLKAKLNQQSDEE